VSAHGLSLQGDGVSVVDEPVEDGIGQGVIADGFVPMLQRKLAGDEGGLSSDPVLQDLEEISALGGSEGASPKSSRTRRRVFWSRFMSLG
jgi:hypothetical protein